MGAFGLFFLCNKLKEKNKMKNRKSHLEQPKRRFNKKMDGEMVRRLFHLMPTAELARMMGLKPRQVSDFVYRNNFEECLGKDAEERKQVASENGRKGGRPRRKS